MSANTQGLKFIELGFGEGFERRRSLVLLMFSLVLVASVGCAGPTINTAKPHIPQLQSPSTTIVGSVQMSGPLGFSEENHIRFGAFENTLRKGLSKHPRMMLESELSGDVVPPGTRLVKVDVDTMSSFTDIRRAATVGCYVGMAIVTLGAGVSACQSIRRQVHQRTAFTLHVYDVSGMSPQPVAEDEFGLQRAFDVGGLTPIKSAQIEVAAKSSYAQNDLLLADNAREFARQQGERLGELAWSRLVPLLNRKSHFRHTIDVPRIQSPGS